MVVLGGKSSHQQCATIFIRVIFWFDVILRVIDPSYIPSTTSFQGCSMEIGKTAAKFVLFLRLLSLFASFRKLIFFILHGREGCVLGCILSFLSLD